MIARGQLLTASHFERPTPSGPNRFVVRGLVLLHPILPKKKED